MRPRPSFSSWSFFVALFALAGSGLAVELPLRQRLPDSSLLVADGDGVAWRDDADHAWRVTGIDEHNQALLETPIGTLAVTRTVMLQRGKEALAALPTLLARAQAAGLTAKDLVLNYGLLTGLHLRSDSILVLPTALLRRSEIQPEDRSEELKRLENAASALRGELAATGLGDLARTSIEHVLALLALSKDPEDEIDTPPDFARRLVRTGWLRPLFPTSPLLANLEASVVASETFRPITVFSGDGWTVNVMRNGLGDSAWTLDSPQSCACLHRHHPPNYHSGAPELMVVVEMPAGSNPLTAADQANSARLYWGSHQLAAWDKQHGFTSDDEAWRLAIPDSGIRVRTEIVSNFLPPHLVIAQSNGDITALTTAHGLLRPPRDGGSAETERFVSEAARILPNPEHLDLIGEHLFTYVFDSPDTARPYLVGNKNNHDDIHQTVSQTLATSTGGICRGDCDDLAEVYHALASRQKLLPHVIDLPAHAATAWTRHLDDGTWTTYILQTGQPLQFNAKDLGSSLALAYRHFDPNSGFGPEHVALELRFAGENTRSHWSLSNRIFVEPDYARTMIDVQRDWHFYTHQQGVAKVKNLIAMGDNDAMNHTELSGLYRRTGQWTRAVAAERAAMALMKDPDELLRVSIVLISLLINGERFAEAAAAAEEIISKHLEPRRKELGQRLELMAEMLHDSLDVRHHADLQRRLIKDFLQPTVLRQTESVRNWVAKSFKEDAWSENRDLLRYRRLSAGMVGDTLALLRQSGTKSLSDDPDLRAWLAFSEDWMKDFGFLAKDGGEFLTSYATMGYFYECMLGREETLSWLRATALPTALGDHRKRIGGVSQVPGDLPWIASSVPFWASAMSWDLWEMRERTPQTFDAQRVLRHLAPLEAAFARCRDLGLNTARLESSLHHAQLTCAMLGRDREHLRTLLKALKARNDRASFEYAATTIGAYSRYLPDDWFGIILDLWRDEVDIKSSYYAIAWNAAIAKADHHALRAGKLAAERFADDPAFVAEYVYLQEVLNERKAEGAIKQGD